VRRAARGAGVQRHLGCVARPVARQAPGPRAGVRLTLGFRAPNLQEEYSTARRPDPRKSRAQGSAHCYLAARRRVEGFPSVQFNGARRRRAPGVLAHWLGVAAARRLLCSPFHRHESTSLFARRRRRSGAQPAQEPHPSRHGNTAARRPAPRQEIHSDASPHLGSQHRKESKGEKREELAGWVAHGGAAMESWPARWRRVRRQGRCSRRWSSASAPAPRP
jgi:hypothetical protein